MNAKAKQRAFFGQGTGRIWMDELRCRDADIDLFSCQQSALGSHNCGHSEDAGVVCAISAGMKFFPVILAVHYAIMSYISLKHNRENKYLTDVNIFIKDRKFSVQKFTLRQKN